MEKIICVDGVRNKVFIT